MNLPSSNKQHNTNVNTHTFVGSAWSFGFFIPDKKSNAKKKQKKTKKTTSTLPGQAGPKSGNVSFTTFVVFRQID